MTKKPHTLTNDLIAKMQAAAVANSAWTLLWSGDGPWSEEFDLALDSVMAKLDVEFDKPFELDGHEFILRHFGERNNGRGGSLVMVAQDAGTRPPARDPLALAMKMAAERGISMQPYVRPSEPPPYSFYIDAE